MDYLKQRAILSIQSNENLAGFVALGTMIDLPDQLDKGWVSLASKSAVELSSQKELVLTHSVYSPDAWRGNREGRLASTLKVAQELRAWLRKVAN